MSPEPDKSGSTSGATGAVCIVAYLLGRKRRRLYLMSLLCIGALALTILVSNGRAFGLRVAHCFVGLGNAILVLFYDLNGQMPRPYGLISDASCDVPGMWWNVEVDMAGAQGGVGIPVWIIVLAAASATCLREYLLVRSLRKSGVCPCGYNLTGNTSGVCPECGRATDAVD